MYDWHDFDELLTDVVFDDAPAGGALMVYHRGKLVVDSAVGQALPDMPWTTDTLSVNFSIGKGVMATLIAILVSRGLLDYDAPISQIWAEFGVNGKADIRLKDVLTHSAGLFDITSITTDAADLLDWERMTAGVANMPVGAPQGQAEKNYASAYSALVSGWILGGLVERATRMRLQDALDTYLALPLGIKGSLFYGVPSDKLNQVAKPVRYFNETQDDSAKMTRRKPVLKPDTPETIEKLAACPVANLWQSRLGDAVINTPNVNRLYFDTSQMNLANYKNALMPNAREGLAYHSADTLSSCIPAANGVSSARALATIYAMHAADGVWDGQALIDADTLAVMRTAQIDGFDAVMPANMRWRMGFHRVFSCQDVTGAYGHMGYNGSVAFADPARELAFVFIHNFDTTMLNDVRQFVLAETAIGLAG